MFNPDMSVWQGRVDSTEGPLAVRWHQRVVPLTDAAPPGMALLGFACDEGVRRNHGRPGAADGPRALRQALANLAWHQSCPVYDAGDVACRDGDLEAAQGRVATSVATLLDAGHRPLVLGGGHETAWGTFLGLTRAKPEATIGIVNLDAHFDLRAGDRATSGTPFAQMADWCASGGRQFRYLCLGVSEAANTAALFERARHLGATWRLDVDLAPWRLNEPLAKLEDFARRSDAVYLSIDLDVLPAATMPAVSAPAGRGVPLESIVMLIDAIAQSGKLVVADIVELNPAFDIDDHGAKVAAGLAWKLMRRWAGPMAESDAS
jgi:formiminoglutamase